MHKIAVGILAGRGLGPEPLQVYTRVIQDVLVTRVFLLCGVEPYPATLTQNPRTMAEVFLPASAGHRGLARQRMLSRLAGGNQYDFITLLDDDTVPEPGYFETLNTLDPADPTPTLFTGKLLNRDDTRCWDICSFNPRGDPCVVPYDDWQAPKYSVGLYASGPQHIFNRAGYRLGNMTQYPDLGYGEDTNFCISFKRMGGVIHFIPDISAKLAHQHNPPNYFE